MRFIQEVFVSETKHGMKFKNKILEKNSKQDKKNNHKYINSTC